MPELEEKQSVPRRFEVLKQVLPKNDDMIEIVTTGSVSEEVKKQYKSVFRRLGYERTGIIPIKEKPEAREEKYSKRVEKAGAVFFTGGDQFRLSTILGGTPVLQTLLERYKEDPDFIVAGTSAGAMVMSKIMIASGGTYEGVIKSDLKTTAGFGLLEHCIVDTHFLKRGRFGRLAQAVITNPGQLGVGLCEDTALIIKNGSQATCTGSGTVIIIDGMNIGQTSITEVDEDTPVFVENLKVHILTKGCRFDLKVRELANPAINPRMMSKVQANK